MRDNPLFQMIIRKMYIRSPSINGIALSVNNMVSLKAPIGPFTILEPHNQEIDDLYLVQKRRATGFDAPIL